jgi:hypothetical protein
VNEAVPVPVGVPEIVPVLLFSVNPAGRLPNVTDHTYPGVPPLAVSAALYFAPSCPAARVAVTMASCGEAMVIEVASVCIWAGDPLSVTSTVNFAIPLPVGVPEIAPVLLFSVNPAGRLPMAIDHV